MLEHGKAILKSCSEILFCNNAALGFLALLVTLMNPHVAACGLLAVVAAGVMARLIGMDREFLARGFYVYNPLLAGLSVGYLFRFSMITAVFVVCAAMFALALTIALNHVFAIHFNVPVLSLPFAITATLAYLAADNCAGLFVNGMYTHADVLAAPALPFWAAGFFKALGAIFFMPAVIPGMLVAGIVLCNSRILFMLAAAGYFTGALLAGLLTGSFPLAFQDTMHFNSILIAMAVGGIFLVPCTRSYLLAMLAVACSLPLLKAMQAFWSWHSIPGFTAPFNIITICFVYMLGVAGYPLRPRFIKPTPEETLEEYLADARRFTGTLHTLKMPFTGRWRVWQGFDGAWTHQGEWKHAYDFIIKDENGSSHDVSGGRPEHYFAWHKPVLAPVAGRVVCVADGLPDNPIGTVDNANPWGNRVVIWDERGFAVQIAHFACGSIRVKQGQWVAAGEILGKCGNSGYSPQPHIHVQAQATAEAGAATLPFSFVEYEAGGVFHANDLPAEGEAVEPLCAEKSLDARLSFMLDDVYEYQALRNGKPAGEWGFKVAMAADGTFCFDSGRARLYFSKLGGSYTAHRMDGADPYLAMLFLALPRMPLCFRRGMTWSDHLPVGVAGVGLRREVVRFFSALAPGLSRVRCRYVFENRSTIRGAVSSRALGVKRTSRVELDETRGFASIQCDAIELRRITHEKIVDLHSASGACVRECAGAGADAGQSPVLYDSIEL